MEKKMNPTNTDKNWKTETTVTDEQAAFYNENGYLKFGRIFTQAELDELRDYVDGMIAALPEGKRPEQMDVPHVEHPYLFKYLADPRVLDVIERFIGPDILLWSSHFISKRTSDGLAVPWHQDGVYWGERLQPMRVITMWLAVDESTVENGCMRVIAGSHKLRDRRYEKVDREKHLFGREVIAEDLDESRIADLKLAVGECHFHDAFTIHGSAPNTSQKRRCGYTMRYMPADVRCQDPSLRPDHDIYLLRGADRTDGFNTYAPIPNF
jgi:hypothetical protein